MHHLDDDGLFGGDVRLTTAVAPPVLGAFRDLHQAQLASVGQAINNDEDKYDVK